MHPLFPTPLLAAAFLASAGNQTSSGGQTHKTHRKRGTIEGRSSARSRRSIHRTVGRRLGSSRGGLTGRAQRCERTHTASRNRKDLSGSGGASPVHPSAAWGPRWCCLGRTSVQPGGRGASRRGRPTAATMLSPFQATAINFIAPPSSLVRPCLCRAAPALRTTRRARRGWRRRRRARRRPSVRLRPRGAADAWTVKIAASSSSRRPRAEGVARWRGGGGGWQRSAPRTRD